MLCIFLEHVWQFIIDVNWRLCSMFEVHFTWGNFTSAAIIYCQDEMYTFMYIVNSYLSTIEINMVFLTYFVQEVFCLFFFSFLCVLKKGSFLKIIGFKFHIYVLFELCILMYVCWHLWF